MYDHPPTLSFPQDPGAAQWHCQSLVTHPGIEDPLVGSPSHLPCRRDVDGFVADMDVDILQSSVLCLHGLLQGIVALQLIACASVDPNRACILGDHLGQLTNIPSLHGANPGIDAYFDCCLLIYHSRVYICS